MLLLSRLLLALLATCLLACGDVTVLPGEEIEGDEPGECTDRADNDADGDFDCDDDGCAGSPDCAGDDDDATADDDDATADDDDATEDDDDATADDDDATADDDDGTADDDDDSAGDDDDSAGDDDDSGGDDDDSAGDDDDSASGAAVCITPADPEWAGMTGADYCAQFGLPCTGTSYWGSSPICQGSAYTACWGSTPAVCCSYPMSSHAGSPASASALWYCGLNPGDVDQDGFIAVSAGGDDCDDADPTVNPAYVEDCADGVDNDCNGLADSADPYCAPTPPCVTSSLPDWALTGDAVCAAQGLQCGGVEYWGSGSTPCSGAGYTGCWGGSVASCCATPMSGHAGTAVEQSAIWTCVP